MTTHDAKWHQEPDHTTGAIGQYRCQSCGLLLRVGYNKHYEPTETGWYWTLTDSFEETVGSSGNKWGGQTYEAGESLLDDVRTEGLQRFNTVPCRPSN
jgi:hypothetical protein